MCAIVRNKYLINNSQGWKRITSIPEAALSASGVGFGDYIYYVGGGTQSGGVGLARRYNTILDTWEMLPDAPYNLKGNTCAVVDNKLYCFSLIGTGGVAIYDITTNKWISKVLPVLETGSVSCAVGTNIYIAGGNSNRKAFQMYNTITGTLEAKSPMLIGHQYASIAAYNNKIYVIGGNVANTEIYDIANETWSSGTSAPRSFRMSAYGLINDNIYIVGGVNVPGLYPVDVNLCYNITSDSWITKEPFPATVYGCASGVAGNYLYVISGYQNNTLSAECFRYKG